MTAMGRCGSSTPNTSTTARASSTIFNVPNPTKWEIIDYLCLWCMWIVCLRYISPYSTLEPPGNVGFFSFVMCILFALLQSASNGIVILLFDAWLAKDASSMSMSVPESEPSTIIHPSNQPNEVVTTPASSSPSPSSRPSQCRNDEDGGTPQRMTWMLIQGIPGPTAGSVNAQSYPIRYSVSIAADANLNLNDANDNIGGSGEERSVAQMQEPITTRYVMRKYFNGVIPPWIQRNCPTAYVPTSIPMRVLRDNPSFAVVCSETDPSRMVYIRKYKSWCCDRIYFFGALILGNFVIFIIVKMVPFTTNSLWWYLWLAMQILWGCSIALAFYIHSFKYIEISG